MFLLSFQIHIHSYGIAECLLYVVYGWMREWLSVFSILNTCLNGKINKNEVRVSNRFHNVVVLIVLRILFRKPLFFLLNLCR